MDSKYPPLSQPLLPPSYERPTLPSGSNRAPPKQFTPLFLRFWLVLTVSIGMICLAAAVEILLMQSEKVNGWYLPGLQHFGGINYLKAPIPVVLTLPLSVFWMSAGGELLKIHPYVVLSKGGAPADRSVLLDYGGGRMRTILTALKFGHWVVIFSSLVGMATMGLSPLASGVLTTRSTQVYTNNVPMLSTKAIGLQSDYSSLEYFVAASGYAAAASIQNLTDPPFLFKGSWAIAEFNIPQSIGVGSNETISVPTTAIESISGCQAADTQNFTMSPPNITITGTWDGCTVTFTQTTFDNDQYGVQPVVDCVTHPEADPFKPLMFWFYSIDLNVVELAFCKPNISLWNVIAEADLTTGLIVNVTLADQNLPASNVSGDPINGQALNGIAFNTSGDNPLVQARALSVQSGVPFAIYRESNNFGGPLATFQGPNGWLNVTDLVYTRFLALAAKSTYFVAQNDEIPSVLSSYQLRLWVYPLDAHLFALSLVGIAVVGALVHFSHQRARQRLFLSSGVGTIAEVTSMVSGSRWPSLLNPGMEEEEFDRALAGRRFRISRQTWQIVAEDEEDFPPMKRDVGYSTPSAASSRKSLTLPYEVTTAFGTGNPRRSSAIYYSKDA